MRSDFSPAAAAAVEMFAMDIGLKLPPSAGGKEKGEAVSTKDSVKDAAYRLTQLEFRTL